MSRGAINNPPETRLPRWGYGHPDTARGSRHLLDTRRGLAPLRTLCGLPVRPSWRPLEGPTEHRECSACEQIHRTAEQS